MKRSIVAISLISVLMLGACAGGGGVDYGYKSPKRAGDVQR